MTAQTIGRQHSVEKPRRLHQRINQHDAATMMSDAIFVEQVTAQEIADASGKSVEWVQDVAEGTTDPNFDDLEVTLNAIGLELRATLCDQKPNGSIINLHNPERLKRRIANEREADMYQFGTITLQRCPPQPNTTRRLFGVGSKRTDGGGRAALLAKRCNVEVEDFGNKVGLTRQKLSSLMSGAWVPTINEFKELLAKCGKVLSLRLEPYEYHDDELQMIYEQDPEAYEKDLEAIRKEVRAYDWQVVGG